jgi:hypothetical protein
MAVFGWILLALLVLALAAGLVLAATPLHLRLVAEGGAERVCVVLEARTLWGLAPAVRLVDTARAGKPARRAPKRRDQIRRAKARSRGGSDRISASRVMRIAGGMPQLIAGEAARIRLDRLDLDARVGTGDPADTGRMFGYAAPFLYGITRDTVSLRLVPDFDRAVFEGKAELALHLIPVALLGPVIQLAWAVFVRPA